MKKAFFTLLAIVLLGSIGFAQKINWETGNLDILKNEKIVATQVIYDGMKISDEPETTFLEDRRKELNEKEAGKGDDFYNHWQTARDGKYLKRFSEHFTKASKEKMAAASDADAKYLIILIPQNVSLGKGRYFGTKPAEVDFEIKIVEKANPTNVLALGHAKGVKGEAKAPKGTRWIPGGAGTAIDVANRTQNFDETNRVAESFELLAVAMGKNFR